MCITTPPPNMCTHASISVNQSINQSRKALQAISRNRLIDVTREIGHFSIEIGLFLRESMAQKGGDL